MEEKIIAKITNKENLLWAWNKTRNSYCVGDIWFDTLELAAFEANLESKLNEISNAIKNGNYEMDPIEPIPYPKKIGVDDEGNPLKRVRQSFYISVKDQVTWIAVVNIIGPDLDHKMPFWSFGNRLHRSVWFENNKLKIGWYRKSTKSFFRTWKQSWPLFRHSIGLTIKKMSSQTEFADKETDMLNNNTGLPQDLQIAYLNNEYWGKKKDVKELYWASVDLEKFYPNVNIDIVKQIILESVGGKDCKEFNKLLNAITTFKVKIDKAWHKDDLEHIGLKSLDENFTGLPTGLFVSGFLANVALLKIDNEVSENLLNNRNIAIFRYVDDHVVIGYSPEDILNWIIYYEKLLETSQVGASFNRSKTEPEAFGKKLADYDKTAERRIQLLEVMKKECVLNPDFPTPLMTQTLAKVSNLGDCDIDFLTETEEKQLIADLEHLLLTDFPDHELRSDTRVSFASGMLSRIMSKKRIDYSEIYMIRKDIFKLSKQSSKYYINCGSLPDVATLMNSKYNFNNRNIKITPPKPKACDKDKLDELKELTSKIKEKKGLMDSKSKKIKDDLFTQKYHIFKLLLKAVKDNHDKVKLWRKIIDYSYNTQISRTTLNEIFDAIEDVYNNGKSHNLSKQYLYSLFVLVVSDRIMRALNSISNEYDKSETEKALDFIYACVDHTLTNKILSKEGLSEMIYYKHSFALYKAITGSTYSSIIHFQGSLQSSINSSILNWDNKPIEWFKLNSIDIYSFMDLLLFRLNNKQSTKMTSLWNMFVEKCNVKEIRKPFETNIDFEKCSKDGYVNIYEWIDWCNERSKEIEYTFDMRLSEWMAVKLASWFITLEMKKTDDDIFFPDERTPCIINPRRYLIPKAWTNPSYKIDMNKEIEMIKELDIDKDVVTRDERYTPSSLIDSYEKTNEFYALYGYAVLLTQIIKRDYQFPWIWNIDNFNVIYSNYVFLSVKSVAISSMTQSIISSCTLTKNRESCKLITVYNNYSAISDDTGNDSPIIRSISDLKKRLEASAKKLRENMVSVKNNQYRQLIPISLKEITNNNNPFND